MASVARYTVIRFENMPIILVSVRGRLRPADHFEIALKVSQLLEYSTGKVCLIIDLTAARIELMDTVDILTQMTKGWSGTPTDPRVITMLALSSGNASLVPLHLWRGWEGWRRVFIFPNLAQALASARGPIVYENVESMTPARLRDSIV